MTALGQRLEGDHAAYAGYLRTASAVGSVAAAKRERDGLLGLAPGDPVLEVGCGLGDDVRRLAAGGARVTGVDVSRAMIDQARAAAPGLEWVCADAQALPFADGTYAAARVERALQHMGDPAAAVREMARVVRPGGVVCACEPDWATLALGAADQDMVDALQAAAEAAIRHPRAGRSLPALLAGAGVRGIAVAAEALVVRDYDLLAVLADLPALLDAMAASGAVSADAAAAFDDGLRADPQLVGSMTLFTAWGTV